MPLADQSEYSIWDSDQSEAEPNESRPPLVVQLK